jgi:DNA-directed RNA polymerase specialized sigma24 family protein
LVTAFVATAAERARSEQNAHGDDDAIGRLSLEWKIARIHVRRLIARADQYVSVLNAVLAGFSYPEVGEKLGISRREVELTVRYLEELLQARGFGG